MGCGAISKLVLGLLLASLGACGGGDGSAGSTGSGGGVSPAPGPSPTPSPAPTPSATPSFSPVAMQLFGDTLYNTDVRVLGHGTLAGPTGPNEPLPYKKFVEANDLAVTYDAAGKLYRVDAGVAGKGVLFQVGPEETDQFPTVVADDAAAAKAVSPEIFVKPAGNDRGFRYVAQVWPWTTTSPGTTGNMFYFGAFGVAQQTRDADVPAAGTVRYAGSLLGWFANDPGGEGLGGVVTLDLDFADLSGSGPLVAKYYCMMGCGYPDVGYTLTVTRRTSASTFEGDVTLAGGAKKGRFSGMLAGPGAAEVLIEITFVYDAPTPSEGSTFAGIIVAKREVP